MNIEEVMRMAQLIHGIEGTIEGRRAFIEHFHPDTPQTPYICAEDLIRRHGELFRRAKEPPPLRPIPKACFQQCYKIIMRKRTKWIYCEGYAQSPELGLICHHSWLTREDTPDEAYDLSWGEERHKDAVYIGIKFKAEFVRAMHKASECKYFSVLDTWWEGHSLLTGKINIEDVRWQSANDILAVLESLEKSGGLALAESLGIDS